MRALVTGGAGFIGSHLVDALLAAGDEVLVVDDLSTGRRSNLERAIEHGARLEVGDITEPGYLVEVASGFRPRQIFHLGAQADVRRAVDDPRFDARVNIEGTIEVLEAARSVAGTAVVFASTGGAIYGEGSGRELPLPEETALRPETPYGASKLAGEVYLDLYRRVHGVPGITLRFGNVYGPRQDPHGEAGVVAIFCGRLQAGKPPVVFGTGRQTRDYVYVGDTVRALLLAGRTLAEDGAAVGGPLNVGTGTEVSVLSLVEQLSAAAGAQVEPEFRPHRPGEVERIAIDPSAAGERLGWAPEVSLEQGLELTLRSVDPARP